MLKQTEIASRQLEREERSSRIRETAAWGELRNAMWKIMDQCPQSGFSEFRTYTPQQWDQWSQNVRAVLDTQIGNPILIEDAEALGYWRSAISTARQKAEHLVRDEGGYIFDRAASSVLEDVMFVWSKLILDSKEVSATGGRPLTGISNR